jgi:antitoxin (DNA-binding transcriptional repressor) of toxin-antitoxin stability system
MKRISADELAAHAADYIRHAAAGESFEIATAHHAVARLAAAGPAAGDQARESTGRMA